MTLYTFDNTFDGLLTAVFDAFARREQPEELLKEGDQMPLFGEQDAAGNPYGHNLYFGLPFYRGFYNRSEILWTPRISSFLHLEAGARFHFGKDGWLGWQQVLSLCFDLQ